MRKSIKAIVCAVSALIICAAPNVANYAGITSSTTAITAEALSNRFGTLIMETYDTYAQFDHSWTVSPNGLFRCRFQENGNFVVYTYNKTMDVNGPFWRKIE